RPFKLPDVNLFVTTTTTLSNMDATVPATPVETDFQDGGAVVVRFSSLFSGLANFVHVNFTRSDLGQAGQGATVAVVPHPAFTDVNIVLDTSKDLTSMKGTTAQQ